MALNSILVGTILGLVYLLQLISAVEYAPIVELPGGKVRGVVQEVYDGEPTQLVNVYQGLRYGRAERFSKPKPAESWSDVYNATTYRFACPQHHHTMNYSETVYFEPGFETVVYNEDCLFVNVFQPQPVKQNRTVMVWIHGGGFEGGTIFSIYYNARYLAALGDVIIVTVNYRLDAFGFLYGGTEDAPGNQGLHDQILALKWVQQNIAHFGGDPKQVTLFGESAGSFSTSALVISPLTKGLFHRAIMQSGATNSWEGSQPSKRSLNITKIFAEHLKCPTDNNVEALKCMRSKSVVEILAASRHSLQNGELFTPFYGDNELLPLPPVKALKEGKFNEVDLMYGTTRNEGSMFVVGIFHMAELDPNNDGHALTLEATKTFITFMMQIFKDPNPAEVTDYYVKHLRLTEQSDKDDLRRAIASVFGDYHLVCPTLLFGEEYAREAKSKKHHYYSYRLMSAFPEGVMGCSGWMGVCHGQDVALVFGLPIPLRAIAFTEQEAQLARDIIHAWTNFAKTGTPGKIGDMEWEEAITSKDHATRFMELDVKDYKMVSDYYKETCDAFWNKRIFV